MDIRLAYFLRLCVGMFDRHTWARKAVAMAPEIDRKVPRSP
jgi:hypothetical protein